MTVRLRCPSCSTMCQVGEEHAGKQVKCGQCGRPLLVPATAPSTPAAAPAASAPPLAKVWSSLRGFYRSVTGPRPAAGAEEEVSFELDGPAAAALEKPATKGSEAPSTGLTPLAGIYRLDIGAATSTGCVRTRNEDSFLVHQLAWSNLDKRHEAALLVVADGMGGYEAGDQASALVLRVVGEALGGLFTGLLAGKPAGDPAALATLIDAAIKSANRTVLQKAQTEQGCKGMGSTAAVVVVCDGRVRIGHVGDCRVYHYHVGKLTQVTRDQTLVARMVELGKLTPAEALTHPNRNEVSQAVGKHPDIQPSAHALELAHEDWLIVCCDGLQAHVDDKTLAAVLAEAVPSAALLAHRLVDLANEGGGTDNCTVLALRCY